MAHRARLRSLAGPRPVRGEGRQYSHGPRCHDLIRGWVAHFDGLATGGIDPFVGDQELDVWEEALV